MTVPLKLDGPFNIFRIIEFEGPFRAPEHLIPEANSPLFHETRSYRDQRFFDIKSNKLIMSFHGIIVQTPRSTILVDTCVGNDKHRPNVPEWHMRSGSFLEKIQNVGISIDQIDYVLCTHLHADHVGWNTRLLNGRWIPTFPKAKYLFGRDEINFWEKEPVANHQSWDDSIQPIIDAGQAEIVASDYEIEPGVNLVPAPGHSPGHVMLKLFDGRSTAYLIGDVIHHPVQVEHPNWSSLFCWNKTKAGEMRTSILETVADTDQWIIPAHFPSPSSIRIKSCTKGFWLNEDD
jgi:glyoxylase-like metal-dependent hydrolase (beta-lactamase superfamily II)